MQNFNAACTKIVGGRGFAPDPIGGAQNAPPNPLVPRARALRALELGRCVPSAVCHPIIFSCHPTCPPMNQSSYATGVDISRGSHVSLGAVV